MIVNVGSGHGSFPSGDKSFPDLDPWQHMAVKMILSYHIQVIFTTIFVNQGFCWYRTWSLFVDIILLLDIPARWRHQMETFSALLAICAGIHRSPVNSHHKGQWRGALMFSLICTWINGRVNNGEASDLRRHCAHYDVTVMGCCVHNTEMEIIFWLCIDRWLRWRLSF